MACKSVRSLAVARDLGSSHNRHRLAYEEDVGEGPSNLCLEREERRRGKRSRGSLVRSGGGEGKRRTREVEDQVGVSWTRPLSWTPSVSRSQRSGQGDRKRNREVEDDVVLSSIVLSSGDTSSSSSVSLSQRSGGAKRKRRSCEGEDDVPGKLPVIVLSSGDTSSSSSFVSVSQTSSLSPPQDETKRRCLQPKRTRTDPPTQPACSLLPPTAQPACSLLPPTTQPACSLQPPPTQPACSLLPPTAQPACSLLPPTAHPACSLLPPTAHPACSLLPPTAQPACSLLPPTTQPACSLLPPTAHTACSLLPPTAHPACSLLPPTAQPACSLLPTALTFHRAVFEGKYVELGCLGTGGFGAVYAGHRRDDNLPVAIKHIPLAKVRRTPVTLDGKQWLVPREVQLLLQAAGGGGRASVALLDWYELDQELLLVLERSVPSVDLFDYVEERGGVLQEDEAKDLLRQLVLAVIEVHSSGVLHRDIKSANVLVETGSGSPRLRIVDFGCGCALREGLYTDFSGTRQHTPPEWFLHAAYEAVPYTVWQLGVMMYDMLCGDLPFETRRHIIKKEPYIVDYLSGECQDLMRRCLSKSPAGRPTLEEILLHPWLHQASRPAL